MAIIGITGVICAVALRILIAYDYDKHHNEIINKNK